MKLQNLKSTLNTFRGEVRNWAGNEDRDRVVPWRKWYTSKQWKSIRAFVISRDQFICGICKTFIKVGEEIAVDHIVPHRGNADLFFNPDNCQSAHKDCHDRKTQNEERQIPLGTETSLAPPKKEREFVF